MNLSSQNLYYYFKYFKSVLGKKIYVFLSLNTFLGIIDGIGLAMFVPLLASLANNGEAIKVNNNSMGNLDYLLGAIELLNIKINPLNIIIIIIMIFIIKGFLKYIQINQLAQIRFEFIRITRLGIIDGLEEMEYSEFIKKDAGKIQNNITTEITKLFNTITNYFNCIQALSMLIIYILLIILTDWQFGLLMFAGGYLINKIYRIITNKIKYTSGSISDKSNIFNGQLLQSIFHFKYLKGTQRFNIYSRRLKQIIYESDKLNLKIGKYQAINEGLKDPIAVLIISILFLLQLYILNGNSNTILLSILLLYRCITQYTLFQTTNHAFANGIGSLISIQSLQKELQQSKEVNSGRHPLETIKEITLENVSLKISNKIILDKINLKIYRNSTIAFVGESGAGKTSLANIITGLIRPSSGHLLINNNQLTDYNLIDYRNKIGYILQEPVIFNDTLYNNVTFFETKSKSNKKKFDHVIHQSDLGSVIQNLPFGEDTVLGDNGSVLSGGERQRVSIARELFKSKEIIIFDEATSSLDSIAENNIQNKIEKLKGTHTIIMITHKLSTIKKADIIYIIKGKTIVEYGNFEYLSANSKVFQTLI